MEYKTTTKTEAKHIVVEAKVNHDTQFYRIKGGDEVSPLPPRPQSPMTFERVDEILWILLPAWQRAGFIKIFDFHPLYQSYWWWRGEALHFHHLFCEIMYRL